MTMPASPFYDSPLWLDHMLSLMLVDTREIVGPANNPEILRLYTDLGIKPESVSDDRHPWCGVCGAACLKRAGLPHPVRFRAARSFALFGEECASRLGAIVVLNRVDPKEPTVPHGHLGFDLVDAHNAKIVLRWAKRPFPKNIDEPGLIWLACGNTHNQVGVSGYDTMRLLNRRWPTAAQLERAGLDGEGRPRSK